MSCEHKAPPNWVWQEVEVGLYGETEMQQVDIGSQSTQEDLDTGRFQCSQCGQIGYYTGRWKAYHEEGIPL